MHPWPEALMSRHKMLLWSPRRTAHLVLFLVSFTLTELGRYVYRPLVYQRGLHDFGVADTMGNHLGAVTLVFFTCFIMHATRRESHIVLGVVTFGYIGYEAVQRFLPGSTADPADAIATAIGGLAAWLLLQAVDLILRRRSSTG